MEDLNHLLFNLNPTPLWLFELDSLKKPNHLTVNEHLKKLSVKKG
jgi:hypothetical protein